MKKYILTSLFTVFSLFMLSSVGWGQSDIFSETMDKNSSSEEATANIDFINADLLFSDSGYSQKTNTLTFSVEGENGTLAATANGNAISSGESVAKGSKIVFTASPGNGYKVKEWTLNSSAQLNNTSNEFTIQSLDVNVVVTVEFEPIASQTYSIQYRVEGNGQLSAIANGVAISSGVVVDEGSNIVFTAAPESDYRLKAWYLNNELKVGYSELVYTIENLSDNVSVLVVFESTSEPVTYPVLFSVAEVSGETNGTLTATIEGTEISSVHWGREGAKIEFTAVPALGYELDVWIINGNEVPIISSLTMNYDLTAASEVNVRFKPISGTHYTVKFGVKLVDGQANGILNGEANGAQISSGASIAEGSEVLLSVGPSRGCRIKEWSLNGQVVENNTSTELTIESLDKNVDVTVEFEKIPPITYTVQFSVIGDNGQLNATVNGDNISSGDNVETDSKVVFTATPNSGYWVKEWSLNGEAIQNNTSSEFAIEKLGENVNVTVDFEVIPPRTYSVQFSVVGGNGQLAATANGATISSGVEVDEGSNIVFTAAPESDYRLKAWYLNNELKVGYSELVYTIENLSDNVSVLVVFESTSEPVTYPVLFSVAEVSGETNGTLTATIEGTEISSVHWGREGAKIEFTAVPDLGYELDVWIINGNEEPIISSLTMNYDLTAASEVNVRFKPISGTHYTVKFGVKLVDGQANGILNGEANGAQISSGASIAEGSEVLLSAVPYRGCRIKEWSLNGQVVEDNTSTELTIESLDKNVDVTVEFEKIPPITYTVQFSVIGDNGQLNATVNGDNISSGDNVETDSKVVFTATPNSGYWVKEWSLNGEAIQNNTSSEFAIEKLGENVNVTVDFEVIPPRTYSVQFSVVGGNGQLAATANGATISSGVEVDEGSNLAFTATPESGYRLKAWYLNSNLIADYDNLNYTIDNLTDDVELSVEFELQTSTSVMSLSHVKTYPNPFTNAIYIQNSEHVTRVLITNLIGKQLVNLELNGASVISTSSLIEGVYLVILESKNGQRVVRKMIKR